MNQFTGNQFNRNPLEEIKSYFKSNNLITRLIAINVAVWLLLNVIRVFAFFFAIPDSEIQYTLSEFLGVPALGSSLIFHPWAIITYMFTHLEFFHILFNMLWLFWFGRIFLQYLNSRQLFTTYIMGGIAGALLYMVTFNLLPVFSDALPYSHAIGASASVMAIVAAIAMYVPNYSINMIFIGRVRIFYIALFLFVMDFFAIRSGNAGGHIAHIGGALWGISYIYMLKKGNDISYLFKGLSFDKFRNTFKKKKRAHFTNVYSNDRPMNDDQYNKEKLKNQDRIDKILDKISKSGYESLSKEEKELLFKASDKK